MFCGAKQRTPPPNSRGAGLNSSRPSGAPNKNCPLGWGQRTSKSHHAQRRHSPASKQPTQARRAQARHDHTMQGTNNQGCSNDKPNRHQTDTPRAPRPPK